MKRTLLQAFLFSILVCVLYIGIQIAIGMYNTVTYVPDIQNQYENVEHLQQSASIGYVETYVETSFEGWIAFGGLFLLGMVSFIAGKLLIQKLKGNRKSNF